ncbi:MAG: hypothetical protein AB8B64_23970 [Granulosicoccus sp.]
MPANIAFTRSLLVSVGVSIGVLQVNMLKQRACRLDKIVNGGAPLELCA